MSGQGCCTNCDGSGLDASEIVSGGYCFDCRGSGHPHDPREMCPPPQTVTICGSMRFFPQMLEVAAELTATGAIVLTPFSVVAPDEQDSDLKMMLDRLHFQKIIMSSKIVVVTNQDHYIGESTRREMEFAIEIGRTVEVRAFDVELTS